MKDFQTLIIENDIVITVWLNRPELHNAMNDVMIAEMTQVFQQIPEDKSVRLIVLRGKGKSFCAGADLNYMKGIANFGFEENVEDGKRLAHLFKSIYDCQIPTVALIHGAVYGGANGLIAACDIVVAEENTFFAFSEVKLGIAPATIAPFVIKRIGEYGAKELMLTGKRFSVKTAEKWNLVNYIYKNEVDENPLKEILIQFVSSAPGAVRETKKLIKTIMGGNIDEEIEITSTLIAKLRASNEGQEGMASFLEKRKANWNKK